LRSNFFMVIVLYYSLKSFLPSRSSHKPSGRYDTALPQFLQPGSDISKLNRDHSISLFHRAGRYRHVSALWQDRPRGSQLRRPDDIRSFREKLTLPASIRSPRSVLSRTACSKLSPDQTSPAGSSMTKPFIGGLNCLIRITSSSSVKGRLPITPSQFTRSKCLPIPRLDIIDELQRTLY